MNQTINYIERTAADISSGGEIMTNGHRHYVEAVMHDVPGHTKGGDPCTVTVVATYDHSISREQEGVVELKNIVLASDASVLIRQVEVAPASGEPEMASF